jgi:hypothetical protein
MKRMMDTSRSTTSHYFSRMAVAITATMITIAPTINQFLPILRVLATRYSCCCLSCAALWPVHRVSFSCCVSSCSAMVFPCAIRAVVVGGLLHSAMLPLAEQSCATQHEMTPSPSPCQRPLVTMHPLQHTVDNIEYKLKVRRIFIYLLHRQLLDYMAIFGKRTQKVK